MVLATGTRFGPYEILSVLGTGGMGEVYRALDTRLGRQVALKTLLSEVAGNPARMARFSREAQMLASLNHPNIAHLHGLEDSGGVPALVMELVEGPTLGTRIAGQPLAIDEALAIARQLTEALDAAHSQGIMHRDLKPANIKVRPDGAVKVLDFGLAKALEPLPASDVGRGLANSPTVTDAGVTGSGAVIGTAAYMSPEQARGLALDKRTDIWAFGCVVFEMLTGRPPFTGSTAPDVTVAVLSREPAWDLLPAATPRQIRTMLRRCLAKDRTRRLADVADARLEIDEALARAVGPGDISTAAPRPPVARGPIAILAAGTMIAAAMVWTLTRAAAVPASPPLRFAIVPPPSQALDIQDNDRLFALSPDGRQIVYRWNGFPTGGPLMLRSLERLDGQPIAGITNARGQFFSFDGRWLAFFEGTALKKVPVAGGPVSTICQTLGFARGGSWGEDDNIVFATNEGGTGLWRVPAAGGTPTALTTPDASRDEAGHIFPSVLPGRRGVLFTISTPDQNPPSEVAVLDFTSGRRKTLLPGASQAEYVPSPPGSGQPGHLVYASAGTLRTVQFDLTRLELKGDSVQAVDQVMTASNLAANYAVRRDALVYLPGEPAPARSLVWVNRHGAEDPINAPPRAYATPRLSPDGKRLAIEVREHYNDLWLWDFVLQKLTAVTFGPGLGHSPVWTPDGRRLIFASQRAGAYNVYAQNVDGSGPVDRLTTSARAQFPTTIAPDGTRLVFNELVSGRTGISQLTVAGGSQAELLFHAPFDVMNGQISPDGRYIAYQSNESREYQVYVRPYPNVTAGHWQVSSDGGSNPIWARNGTELFFLDGSTRMTAVPVQTSGTTYVQGNPQPLFDARSYATAGGRAYDVAPDGSRFLLIKEPAPGRAGASSGAMVVVLNWLEEIKAKLPAVK